MHVMSSMKHYFVVMVTGTALGTISFNVFLVYLTCFKQTVKRGLAPNYGSSIWIYNHYTSDVPGKGHVSGLSYLVPKVHLESFSCKALFRRRAPELKNAILVNSKRRHNLLSSDIYLNWTTNCKRFIKDRGYITRGIPKEEEAFPIAYSIMLYKDVEQVERLLRAIYRPQNFYCLHVDRKAPADIHRAIHGISRCFDNVMMAHRSVSVHWAWFSVVESELVCMETLWRHIKWKYFINLTGQEFPLHTNGELVKILKAYNGGNDMEGTIKRRNWIRTKYIHNGPVLRKPLMKKSPAPFNITIVKGSVHMVVTRGFVNYILHNPVSRAFRKWVKDTGYPDETYFASLNHNPRLGAPGAYKGEPETDAIKKPFLARYKEWYDSRKCKGKLVRSVCNFGLGDLWKFTSRKELFVNKFDIKREPLALTCMEELLYNRTRDEFSGRRVFNDTYYRHLSFAVNHV